MASKFQFGSRSLVATNRNPSGLADNQKRSQKEQKEFFMFSKFSPVSRSAHRSLLVARATIAGAALAVLGLTAGTGLTSTASADVVTTFQASTGFSGTQGANGWSYAGVYFPNAGALATNEMMATYNSPTLTWQVSIPGTGGLSITSTQQNMIEGNAYFSLRYFTASRHYDSVSITGNLVATADAGANIIYYNATSQTQANIPVSGNTTTFVTAPPTQTVAMDASLTNINVGDRIYFELQNTGLQNADGSGVMETWDPIITASYAVPETATFGLMGAGTLGLLLLGKGKRRRA